MLTSNVVLQTQRSSSSSWKPLWRWSWLASVGAAAIIGLGLVIDPSDTSAVMMPVVVNFLLFSFGLIVLILAQRSRLSGSLLFSILAGEFVLKLLITMGLLLGLIMILNVSALAAVASFSVSFVLFTAIRLALIFPVLRQATAPESRGES